MSYNQSFKSLYSGLSKVFNIEVLDSRTVMKICCILILQYFSIYEVAKVGQRLKEHAEELWERPRRAVGPVYLLFLLGAIEVSLKYP